jgi:hypothetical protein
MHHWDNLSHPLFFCIFGGYCVCGGTEVRKAERKKKRKEKLAIQFLTIFAFTKSNSTEVIYNIDYKFNNSHHQSLDAREVSPEYIDIMESVAPAASNNLYLLGFWIRNDNITQCQDTHLGWI